MSWAIGYDEHWERDVGYGVPSYCDHPDCKEEIDRGLGYICGDEPGGGEHGCGLFFCSKHQVGAHQTCTCCASKKPRPPFTPSADHTEWLQHKLTDISWGPWRNKHKAEVKKMREALTNMKECK